MTEKRNIPALESRRTAASVLAVLAYSLALNLLAVPAGVYCGGLSGLCQVVRTLLAEWLRLPIEIDIASIIYYVLSGGQDQHGKQPGNRA